MKSVAIFRFTRTEEPGYFATFLDARSIPWKLIRIDEGETVPDSAAPFSGICLMGGTISVNDPLPWIGKILALIRQAVAARVPVIGHCLGGQLMSRALGGEVIRNPVQEIGWGTARIDPGDEAKRWFGPVADESGSVPVFQWHGETFSIPPGATRLLTSRFCANQMFALGPHLAMQCHVEMTEAMIGTWCEHWENETRGLASLPDSVETPDEIRRRIPDRLPALRRLADQLYSVWIRGLA
ncbi:MAG: type 1 glutamine amidotransferase [Candidatus Accumulibacter sp.]|jgi:GMP synthase-like glutamine amidotransferase|nr:type 1 glutamine amidotransferase [Accumulibacter sp.]